MLSQFFCLLAQSLDFLIELVQIVKLPIDAGEANIGHTVQFAKETQDQFSNVGGGDFPVHGRGDIPFDKVREALDSLGGYGPFLASGKQSTNNFMTIKGFPNPIFFHDHERDRFYRFMGGEAQAAFEALPPPSDKISLGPGTRVDNFAFEIATVGTEH
jgi:hypothetical protein